MMRFRHDSSKAAQLDGLKRLEMQRWTKKDVVKVAEFETQCVHGDCMVEDGLDHAPPLHVATAYELKEGVDNPWVYARNDTPTRDRLEKLFGMLEGGHALTFSSGMAAISTTLLTLKVDALWLVNVGYTGTHSFLNAQERLKSACVASFEDLQAHRGPNKVIYCESVRNPDANLCDLDDLVAKATLLKAVLIVDSTFATPGPSF